MTSIMWLPPCSERPARQRTSGRVRRAMVRRKSTPRSLGAVIMGLAAFSFPWAVVRPGFAYLRNRRPMNPADLLLRALRASDVDARVVEALPWVLLKYPDLDWAWLLRESKVDDLQNRLGFLVSVARQLAALRGETGTAKRLAEREQTL